MQASKPMLASDWSEKKLKFPVIMQPKIDGVRGVNLGSGLTGRSLKAHANKFTTARFSQPEHRWLDGELAAGSRTSETLCRDTTSAMNTIEGEPQVVWHLFDRLEPGIVELPYQERLASLMDYLRNLWDDNKGHNLIMIESFTAHKLSDVLGYEEHCLKTGFEGLILRDPFGKYKSGRSTATEGGLLRIKRFTEEEAVVTGIVEGETNNNEATINELGLTERSTHQKNMIPNGMVGSLTCRDMKSGDVVTVAAGKMSHADRVYFFQNPMAILGKVIKYQAFPKGVKDKPRFPTFQSLRAESDL